MYHCTFVLDHGAEITKIKGNLYTLVQTGTAHTNW